MTHIYTCILKKEKKCFTFIGQEQEFGKILFFLKITL